jgi:type IV secretory pathway VirB2 component (pilin)
MHSIIKTLRAFVSTGALQKCFLAALIGMTFVAEAHADIASILCDIYDNVLIGGSSGGGMGRGLATMAIIALGISATLGKVSWGMAVMVGVGIAIFFGAATIASDFGVTAC